MATAPTIEPGTSVTTTASPAPVPEPTGNPGEAFPNDLKVVPLQRSFKSDGLTISVDYTTPVPIEDWTADGAKTIRVALTVHNNRVPAQKIYITKATARFTISDGTSDLPGPDPVVDTANLSPGYLCAFPYSYGQSFAIPPLDAAAANITIDFKFELVTLVDQKAKDYTKQTATNTVRSTLNF